MQNDCLHDWKDVERYSDWIFRSGAAGALLPEPLNIGHSAWSGIQTVINRFCLFAFVPCIRVAPCWGTAGAPMASFGQIAETQSGTRANSECVQIRYAHSEGEL